MAWPNNSGQQQFFSSLLKHSFLRAIDMHRGSPDSEQLTDAYE